MSFYLNYGVHPEFLGTSPEFLGAGPENHAAKVVINYFWLKILTENVIFTL